MAAAEAAAGKLSAFQWRRWLRPEMAAATPTTPAIMANVTKNPVAAFPIGKDIGEKCAGRSSPGPVCGNATKAINQSSHSHCVKIALHFVELALFLQLVRQNGGFIKNTHKKRHTNNETMINSSVHGPATNSQNYNIHAKVEHQKKSCYRFELLTSSHFIEKLIEPEISI